MILHSISTTKNASNTRSCIKGARGIGSNSKSYFYLTNSSAWSKPILKYVFVLNIKLLPVPVPVPVPVPAPVPVPVPVPVRL